MISDERLIIYSFVVQLSPTFSYATKRLLYDNIDFHGLDIYNREVYD